MYKVRKKLSSDMEVEYILTKAPYGDADEYSIFCASYDANGNLTDDELAERITSDGERAKIIFDTIQQFDVTPCTLQEVLVDLVDQ